MRLTDYWFARTVLCSYILLTHLITWFDPQTQAAFMISASGSPGWVIVAVVAALAALELVDILVNDMLPAGCRIMFIYNRRHLIFLAMAVGSLAISAAIAETANFTVLLFKYWLDMALSFAMVYLEMFPRHRSKRLCS